MDTGNTKPWQATLTPHRSLTKQGFVTVMVIIAVVNVVVGAVFMAIGAWPVAGFAGLDVALMWWAFKANFADARRMERISITDHEVVLECLSQKEPPRERRFVRRWVRVELEEFPERELIGRLSLVAGRERVPIGDFLAGEERKSLAHAFKSALAIPRI